MLFGTLLGILVIPVLFIIFQTLQEKLRIGKEHGHHDNIEIEAI